MIGYESSREKASFGTQADALLRKNVIYQKRNAKTNCILISFPLMLCLFLSLSQKVINRELNTETYRCGCKCVDTDGRGTCIKKLCGLQFSDLDQVGSCAISNPPAWPALLHIPPPEGRAVRTDALSEDFPPRSCRPYSCPTIVLYTGRNQTFGQGLAENLFSNIIIPSPNINDTMARMALGSGRRTRMDGYLEPGFYKKGSLNNLMNSCTLVPQTTVTYVQSGITYKKVIICLQALTLWRNSSSVINSLLFRGYYKGNSEKALNEIQGAYDFLDSDDKKFNVTMWYNATNKDTIVGPFKLLRVPRAVNLASSAYLKFLLGSNTEMLLEFVKDFPKPETQFRLDFASLLGPLFYTWTVLLLFPVVLTSLVYEKQQKLRIMMKMHGLGDGPYWMISYAYFFSLSFLYILVFVIFGSAIGLKFFTLNDYGLQFVFYFLYINLQISFAFLVACFFSNGKTATVTGYICVFASGLLGSALFQTFAEDTAFPKNAIIIMELYPGFALYRGLYEFAQYSFMGNLMGTRGMTWENLWDEQNGLVEVMIIMVVEFFVLLVSAYYVDQLKSSGNGKNPLLFLQTWLKNHPRTQRNSSWRRVVFTKVFVDDARDDISQERENVNRILRQPYCTHAIVCDNLSKVYGGRDGNSEKVAVKGLSLALPRIGCFGMLGPNGAGKTSFISMMIGLTRPTQGTAYVDGMDILTDMGRIYSNIGVCPQHDLLWENLSGREHLLFYGRLKNLKGYALDKAVEESLRSVNLHNAGVANKQSGKYSGGMKRRLSVAISLIGNPKVVYMDEPSTGLDPASRSNLWNVVRRAKRGRSIILTTHSMEEAEALCDRIGIFVDGDFQCIGNPKQLKARYGGSYVFTMTTSSEHEAEVVNIVKGLSPGACRTYHTSGTQKFEMPKDEVRISEVFHAVEVAKTKFTVFAWGLSDITLEDVFIKVATQAMEPK